MRAETGVMQFAGDWPGIFIRGDTALFYSVLLEKIPLEGLSPLEQETLRSLRKVLESCREKNRGDHQHLKPFQESIALKES